MQTQTNKRTWLKWLVISCGIVICIVAIVIIVIPIFISEDYIRQKVAQTLEEKIKFISQIGTVSFHSPNHVNIPYIIIQRQEQNTESPIRFDDVQCAVKLFPLLLKKVVIKNISIREINYENRLLIKDLATDKFSFKNGIISACLRLSVNEGPATVKGTIDLNQEKPIFDILISAKGIHITQDVPTLNLIPIFTVKEGEFGGILDIEGHIRGKGIDNEILNKNLNANMRLMIKDGYIRGNKLISSVLEIIGVNKPFSFDLMEAVIQIEEGKIHTPKISIRSSVMELSASGTTEFEGNISYDAVVKFNKEYLNKDIEKIAGLVLKQNTLPVEIRGTTKDPKISIKISKDNVENLVRGLVNDFLDNHKEKHKKEKENN